MEDNLQAGPKRDNKSGDSETAEELNQQENFPVENMASSNLENTQAEGIPPIDILELAKVLRDPNMPSQNIMNEVADHMVMMAGQKENSSDTSDSEGLKRVVDCIIEVCLRHEDSDNSEDDDDYYEEDRKILREIPCKFCNKIFNSSMTCKTHILVAHPQQDPSMLNIKYLSEREVNKKNSSSRRRSSRCSSKTEADSKSLQPLEKGAHEETKAMHNKQRPIAPLQSSPLPGLSESVHAIHERSKFIQEESASCMESTAQPKGSSTTETCDTNISSSIDLPEPGVGTETKCASSDQHGSHRPTPQRDNNSPSSSNSSQASKHKLLESDSYADTSSKKSRVDSSDFPTS